MAVRAVTKMGNPVLRLNAEKLADNEISPEKLADLIQDLEDTMKFEGGIGIAAPQIGISKQVTIIQLPAESDGYEEVEESQRYVIINPEIEYLSKDIQGFWEGCLSVPGLRGYVERPNKIAVTYTNLAGERMRLELEGFLATVFQHEIDHLFGKLYIDRMKDITKLSFMDEYSQFHEDN